MTQRPKSQKIANQLDQDQPSLQIFAFVLFVTFLTFIKVFTAQYVTWDDPVLVLENPLLKLPFLKAVPVFFTSYYHGDYMPLTLISYWIEVAVFAYDPLIAHLFNLVLHLGCGIALYKFLSFSRAREIVRILICAVFLLHPLQVESVMWISERKGLLSSFLLLCAMIVSQLANRTDGKQRSLRLFAYYFLFLGSLLAKATGVFMPAFLMGLDVFYSKGSERLSYWKAIRKHFIPGLFALAIVIIRVNAYGVGVSGLSSFFFEPERWVRLPLVISSILGFYLSSFLFPFSQSIIYPEFKLDLVLAVRILILLCFILSIVRLWKRTRNLELGLFVSLSLVLLLPILQIIPRINFVSDRYMYLPSIGVAGLLSIQLQKYSIQTLKFILFITVVFLAPISYLRSEVWGDSFSLWNNAVETASWSGLSHNNYALALENKGDIKGAIIEFEKAIVLGKRDGTDNLAYNNLGVIYSYNPAFIDRRKAIDYFEKGILETRRPEERFSLRLNLADSYVAVGESVKARVILVELESDLVKASRDKKFLDLLEKTQGMIKALDVRVK